MNNKKIEIFVGLFMLLTFLAVVFICLRVADIKSFGTSPTYRLYAIFDNVGGLKAQSPIKVGGVVIGRIADITLEQENYLPKVAMDIYSDYDQIPESSSLSIRSAGLLGEQFIAVNIGFKDEELGIGVFKEGDIVQDTKPAMQLEDIIGQFLYKTDSNSAVEPAHS